jgi:purine-nucleoside phosphorylase
MTPELQQSLQFIHPQISIQPKLGIILGSGLGSFADNLDSKIKIPTEEIPHYPVSTVHGHMGFLVFGNREKVPLVAVQGRTHFYEGYSIQKVTYVVRLLAALGVKILIVTNAAGGINPNFLPGDLMLITDQINNMFQNPLRGPLEYGGPRFPDMSEPYSTKYFGLVETVARENNIDIKRGTLYVSSGPSYETAAEVKMIAKIGGDAASMSTVPEVIVARQSGLEVIGISCITNHATGISKKPLSHKEVTDTASLVQQNFFNLLSGIIHKINEY